MLLAYPVVDGEFLLELCEHFGQPQVWYINYVPQNEQFGTTHTKILTRFCVPTTNTGLSSYLPRCLQCQECARIFLCEKVYTAARQSTC